MLNYSELHDFLLKYRCRLNSAFSKNTFTIYQDSEIKYENIVSSSKLFSPMFSAGMKNQQRRKRVNHKCMSSLYREDTVTAILKT